MKDFSIGAAGSRGDAARADASGRRVDRRWYPDGDPIEWARTTRTKVFESAKRCIAKAIASGMSRDIALDEMYASDETFRELYLCTVAYARGLYALGQPEAGVVGLILVAAREAADPGELHPAIAAAIEQWCHEAHAAVLEQPPTVD